MEFLMLGPFEARHDGLAIDLGDLQQRYALVVLLLHANKPVSTERLIDIVWGDKRPKTNLVPGYIAKIRKSFRAAGADDVTIETTPTGYVLRVDPSNVDSVRFIRLCDQASRARASGDPALAARLLHGAVELWRGDFLEDLDIDRIGGSQVISLDDALLDALCDLAELELARNNHRWVRDRLRPAVFADPSRQRPAMLLMRALLANGDRVEAMKIYHRTRDALDEYGMKTTVELRGLARLAQYGEPHSTLPAPVNRFTGRTEQLACIESLAARAAAAGNASAVWLSGMPGVGKTALAVEAAYRLRHKFMDGRIFLSLNGFTQNLTPTTPAEALASLLSDLGVPAEQIPPTVHGRAALYQDRLIGTSTVVVLDNAASEEQVEPLLPQASGCMAIVTSRRACGLQTSDNIRLGPLPATEAAELFRNLVGPERLRGRSTEVAEVVRRCGWVPLQIGVVASQFRRHDRWPLDHLLTLLGEAGLWRPAAGFDNRGVVACLVSYQQLNEQSRTLFRLFGHIPGQDLSVSGAAALSYCDPLLAQAVLDDLHGVSVLEEVAPGRYHMLDPLREFAASVPQPATPHESTEALERLLDYYLVATASAVSVAFPFDRDQQPVVDRRCSVAPVFADHREALAWLATERTNLVAAIRCAAANQRRQHTWQLAVLLWRFFNTMGHIEDWTSTLTLARQAAMADPTNRYGQAHVLLRLSGAHWRAGQLTEALELAAQALPFWVQLGDVRGQADTLCAIAVPTMELGDHDRAISHFEAAMTRYEQIDDKRGQANALSVLGHLNELHGRLEIAEQQQLTAVGLLRAVNHQQGLAHALDNLGSVRRQLGQLREALDSHEEARQLAVDLGDVAVQAYALNNIGNVHRELGHLDAALRYQEQAMQVAHGVVDANLRTHLYLDRGETYQARGDPQDALRAYQAALDLASGTGDRSQRAHASRGVARAMHALGRHTDAAVHWHAAAAEFADLHQPEASKVKTELHRLRCACTG